MKFQIVCDVLEIHDCPEPDGGVTTWFMHPGLPPIYHRFPSTRAEPSSGGDTYCQRDVCILIAATRYEAYYEHLSAHGQLAVHSAIAEARACRVGVDRLWQERSCPVARYRSKSK